MKFRTEEELLSATKTDDTDKRMQRALKLLREIRALGTKSRNEDETSALVQLHLTIGCAVLGLHAMKNYDFIAFQLACQPDEPRGQADMFRRLPTLINEPDVEEIDELIDECDEALAAWRE